MKCNLRIGLIVLIMVLIADVAWGDDVCPGDVDEDGRVTADDQDGLIELLFDDARFDLTATQAGDANGDGVISGADLLAVAELQGTVCGQATRTPSTRPSPTATLPQNTRSATPTATTTPATPAAYGVLLRWTTPPEPDVSGYRIYSGTASRAYGAPLDVGLLAGDSLDGVVYSYWGVPLDKTVFVAVTAYNSVDLASDYSNEKVLDLRTAVPPMADAGPDRAAEVSATVTIGSAPRPRTSYFWQQTGGPPGMLAARTSSRARLTGTIPGIYTLTVTTYDAQGVATRASVRVTLRAPESRL